ncbi:MAG: DUF3887 domain-containing protein, partial [Halobaculum sp.]
MSPARRAFLQRAAAVAAAGAVAGCGGTGDGQTEQTAATRTTAESDGTATPSGPDSPTMAATATATAAPTVSPTATDSPTATATPRNPAVLEQAAAEFVRTLAAGEFETAHGQFTERAASSISPSGLEDVWNRFLGDKGALEAVASADYRGRANGQSIVVVRARFEEGRQRFLFGFVADGLMAFRIQPPQAEYTPPSYVDPSAFTERTLELDAPGDCSLGATLTLPTAKRG